MKKLLCIALFSVITSANAKNKLEIVKNNYENGKMEMISNFDDYTKSNSKDAFFLAGCGAAGNVLYDNLMATGHYTHRQARAERRALVRDCRGLPKGGWLGEVLKYGPSIIKALF